MDETVRYTKVHDNIVKNSQTTYTAVRVSSPMKQGMILLEFF